MRLVERIIITSILILFMAACSELEEPISATPQPSPNELPTQVLERKNSNSLSCQETFDYFMEVAHKIEGLAGDRPIRKWGVREGLGHEIFVYVSKLDSSFERDMFAELEQIVAEVNNLTDEVNLKIIEGDPQTSYELNALRIYLGNIAGYKTHIEPEASVDSVTSDGFFVYHSVGNTSEVVRGSVWVDTVTVFDKQRMKHVLREEVTQVLGLTNDSNRYEDSIFFQGDSQTTSYSKGDRDLLRILHHPDIKVNMSKAQTQAVLDTIDTRSFECSSN